MIRQLRNFGISSDAMYLAALASIALSIGIWVLRREEDKANAERFGIFVGLWAPTFMSFAKALKDTDTDALPSM